MLRCCWRKGCLELCVDSVTGGIVMCRRQNTVIVGVIGKMQMNCSDVLNVKRGG